MGAIYILDNLTDHGFLRKLSYLKSTVEFRNGTFFPEPNSYLRLFFKKTAFSDFDKDNSWKFVSENVHFQKDSFAKIH